MSRNGSTAVAESLGVSHATDGHFAVSVQLTARIAWFDGSEASDAALRIARDVPVETAVNVVYGETPYAVMMTTPDDLTDFAYGFSLTEGLITAAAEIRHVELREAMGLQTRGLELVVSLAPHAAAEVAARTANRARNTAGRTGCGICGIDQLDALPHTAVRLHERSQVPVSLPSIRRALQSMEHAQSLNQRTHAVHAAAWCSAQGNIIVLREDVGRHNALDKLIGALLRAGHEPSDGFLVITSRCSFEMVEKAAAYGAATLVAVSAPTSLAVERAILHDMTLLAIARRDSALIFHGAERVQDADQRVSGTPPAGSRSV